MKSKAIMFFVLICSALLFGSVNTSQAACGQYGKLIYTYQTPTFYTAYLAPMAALPTYYYIFYGSPGASVGNGAMFSALSAAKAANEKVYVVGNAASCPTSGTYRYGGYVQYFYTYTLY
jgi:membrane protease YdiL (CAAX protease family)